MSPCRENVQKVAVEHGPSTLEHVDYLDGWRGLAITCVLQAHFFPIMQFETGRLGVDIFFVLSGLLMARLLFVKRVPLKTFYERRISRILPVFLLYLAVVYAIAFYNDKPIDVSEAVSTLTFFRTYYPSVPHIWQELTVPTGHLWSLNIEEHSYIFMSVLTLIACIRKRESLVLIAVGLAALLTYRYYLMHKDIAPHLPGLRTECAAAFIMISAGYSLIKHKIVNFIHPAMPVVSFFIAVLCYYRYFPFWSVKTFFVPFLLAFTVNHLSEAYGLLTKVLCFRPLRLLGLWSYSIYIWQQPIHVAMKQNVLTINSFKALLYVMIISLTSFYFFENPSRRWLNERKYRSLFTKLKLVKVVQPAA